MDVLESTRRVFEHSRSVRTDHDAIRRWADAVDPDRIKLPTQPHDLLPRVEPARLANLVLLIDGLNFCFFAEPPWRVMFRGCMWGRYYALVASIARAVERDAAWYKPAWWKAVSRHDLAEAFAGEGQIPMLDERVGIVNELGRVLSDSFAGQFLKLIDKAGGDAVEVARLLAQSFQAFDDRATYDGRTVWILKRAQICAAHAAVAMKAADGPPITGLERLTAFADYRLPQALRHLGIMALDASLESRIERQEWIEAGSAEEVELRVHTIWAVELMHRALAERGVAKPVWLIDEYLWERSHDKDIQVQHHRTRTIWY